MSPEPLWVEFCGNTVAVQCPQSDLRDTLKRLLVHCLVDDGSERVVSTYHVSMPEPEQVRVEHDGEVVYNGRLAGWVVLYVLQNLTSALTGNCRQELNFHSAGLARQGQGLLLCGASGSGKSTLTAWPTGSGFQFLTDELVGVSVENWSMTGLPRPIHLKPGSVFVLEHWLGEEVRSRIDLLADGSALVPPLAFSHTEVIHTAVPEIVIFPKYSAQSDFRWQRISTGQTAFHLAHSLVNAINLPGHGMSQVVALSKRVTGYSVEFALPDQVAEWLDTLVR